MTTKKTHFKTYSKYNRLATEAMTACKDILDLMDFIDYNDPFKNVCRKIYHDAIELYRYYLSLVSAVFLTLPNELKSKIERNPSFVFNLIK